MDYITHEILLWKHIETEKVDHYKYLLKELKKIMSRLKYSNEARFTKALDI